MAWFSLNGNEPRFVFVAIVVDVFLVMCSVVHNNASKHRSIVQRSKDST